MPLKRIASLAVLILAASGCSWFASEPEDLSEHEVRLSDMFNESARLIEELNAAEARIIRDCLEDQGFAVHLEAELAMQGGGVMDGSLLDGAPHERFLVGEDQAASGAYWQWTNLPDAQASADPELWEASEADSMGLFDSEAESAVRVFLELDAEDQYAWYVAYMGEERASVIHADLIGADPDPDGDGVVQYDETPPGGCWGEMIEAVYGGAEAHEVEGEDFTDWTWEPEPPVGDGSEIEPYYLEAVAEYEGDFLDCLYDSGWGVWEFRKGYLAVNEYLVEAGEGDQARWAYEGSPGSWPEPPEDVPDEGDFEGWLEFERGFALDVVACGESSGYREAAEEAWKQAQLAYYLQIEEETYAWQETMQGLLERAQEVIAA